MRIFHWFKEDSWKYPEFFSTGQNVGLLCFKALDESGHEEGEDEVSQRDIGVGFEIVKMLCSIFISYSQDIGDCQH